MGVIVDHDPFTAQPAPKKGAGPVIVDHDPFAAQPAPKGAGGPVVVDRDPFAPAKAAPSAPAKPAPAKKAPYDGFSDIKFDPVGAIKQVASDYSHAPQTFVDDLKGSVRQVKQDLAPLSGKPKGLRGAVEQQTALPRAVGDALGAIPGAIGDAIYGKPVSDLTQLPRDKVNLTLMGLGPERAGPARPTALGSATRAAGRLAAKSQTLNDAARVARDTRSALKTFIAPTTASEKAAKTGRIIRGARATLDTEKEVTAHDLVGFNAEVSRMPVEKQRALADYIENRSKGGLPPDVLPPEGEAGLSDRGKRYAKARGATSTMRQTADRVAANFQRYKDLIGKHVRGSDVDAFVDDYYAHMWQEKPTVVRERLGEYSRQGSGRNLRQRKIPTIEDGIKAGLTPKFENPVETTMAYAHNMSRFLSTHATLNELRDLGYTQFFRPGKQPEGWVPLDGILTERAPPPPARFPRTGKGGVASETAEAGEGGSRIGGPGDLPRLEEPGPERVDGPPGQDRIGERETQPPAVRLNEGPGEQGRIGAEQRRVGGSAAPQIEDAAAGARKVFAEPKPGPDPYRDRPPRVNEKLYAPADVARVYNRSISPGYNGPLYEALRTGTNAGKAVKLGLSAFHATTMAGESTISDLARAFQAASRGDLRTAAKALRTSAPGVSAVARYRQGLKLEKAILDNPDDLAPLDRKLASLYPKAGGRIGMDPFYTVRKGISFLKAWERDTLGREIRQALGATTRGSLGQRTAAAADLALNVLQSVSDPLFEKAIPRLKRGAWASRMSDWLAANPGATDEEATAYGSKLIDSIDNRFGELVMDNVFWSTKAKQISSMFALSPGWNIGTIREIGGGALEVPASVKGVLKGEGVTDKTAYLMALAATVATVNGIATYLKTGEAPHGADFAAYRTGGTDAATGEPERAMFPGYQKDVYSFAHNAPRGLEGLTQEAVNKLGDVPRMSYELAANSDYRGDPIYSTPDAPLPPTSRGLAGYLSDELSPIALSQKPEAGSKISGVERFLGVRPAPRYITAPEQEAAQYRARQRRRAKAAGKHEAQRQAREEGE